MFSERLEARARAWWGPPSLRPPREGRRARLDRLGRYMARPRLLHRLRETFELRHRDDPDARWRCCAHWQRTLGNKWNSREFAQRHGCRVPMLYWSGRRPAALPVDGLPVHCVIRPAFGDSRRGVYVLAGDRELLRETRCPRASLASELRRAHGRLAPLPLLVEEFVRTESGEYRLPTEYKCHTFGDIVGAVEVVRRRGAAGAAQAFYRPTWERIPDRMNTHYPVDGDVGPPRCLSEMLGWARRLGTAYGSYVRVDLYATDRGGMFGEFSSKPYGALEFTPYAERYFDDLWREAFPDGR